MHSEIRYARSKHTRIAYQVLGSGKQALILINGWVSNLEEGWHLPGVAEWLTDLARFTRLIVFDKRGVGLSDRVPDHELPGLAERMDDLRAIMDQENIEKATLLGFSEGGPMAIQFSVSFPERVKSLILYGSYACWLQSPDYPIGLPEYLHKTTLQAIDQHWGQAIGLTLMAPSVAGESLYQKAWASFLRKSASPGAAKALYQMNLSIDVRSVLPAITVPVLVMHRKEDKLIPFPLGQFLAEHIPGATLITFPGMDHLPWIGDSQAISSAISKFMGEPYQESSQITKIGTLAAIKTNSYYPDKHLIEVLQQEGCIFSLESDDVCLVVFESPEMALTILHKMMVHKKPESWPVMVIHTGVYNRQGTKICGPAVEWLTSLLPELSPGYIWLTQAAWNLLPSIHFAGSILREISLNDQSGSVTVYAGKYPESEKLPYQSVLQEGKLRKQDIAVLLNIRKYLEENYLSELTLTGISRTFAINTFKLKYGFKTLFDMAVMQFVQELRLEHALQLLLHSDMSVTDIADLIGYQQPGNFSKAFSKKYGKNPVDLRRKAPVSVSL